MTEPRPQKLAAVRKRFSRVIIFVCVGILSVLLFVLLLPTIVTQTGLRNVLLAKALPARVSATCDRASIGWFSPLDATGIAVTDSDGRWTIKAEGASSEKTLLQIVTNSTQLGEFVIDQPLITVNVDAWANAPASPAKPPDGKRAKNDVAVAITVRDATIQTVSNEVVEPNVIARNVTVVAEFERSGERETLTIEPGTPLDHAELSPEMCRSLLKYIAPVVSNTAWTEGAISVELSECMIPLDSPEESVVSGLITIHAVNVGVREGVGQQVTQLVASLMKKDIPTKLKLANESQVEFVVANGIVSHRGLAFGLPEISDELVIETHGFVGFDKRLDLKATVPLPFHLLGDGVIVQALGSETLHVPIKGTLDSPEIQFQPDGQLGKLIGKVADPILSGETSVAELLSGLRQWREKRNAERAESTIDESAPDQTEGLDDDRPTLLERFRNRKRRGLFRRNADPSE